MGKRNVGFDVPQSRALTTANVKLMNAEETPEAAMQRKLATSPSNQSIVSEASVAQEAARTMKHTEAGSWTIAPDKNHHVQNWDVVLCIALVYTAVVTPAEVGFVQDTDKVNEYVLLFTVNMFINLIFICDVTLQFFLHYQLPKAKGLVWVRNHKRIVKHYLKGYFWIDFPSSLPFGAIAEVAGGVFGDLTAVRLLRLLRLAKLLRIMRSSRLINRYRADLSVSYGVVHLVGFVVATVLFSHWLACLWGFTANASSSGLDNSWMTAFETSKWNIRNPKHQYVISLYFAIMTLTTVGYGDVLPQNMAEYGLMIVMMFLGGFMWAYIIGSVCAVTATLDIKNIEHQQLYDQINNMLVDLTITRPVAASVRSYLFQTEAMERRVGYGDLIESLSPELQATLCEEISAKHIGSVPYFARRTSKFRLMVFKHLTRKLFCPQEEVREDRLLIIANDGVAGSNGRVYTSGTCLNKDFFLQNASLRENHMVRALNYVEFEMLSAADLNEILRHNPQDRVPILWARVFYAMIRKVRATKKANKRVSKVFSKAELDADYNTHDLVACYGAVKARPVALRDVAPHVKDAQCVCEAAVAAESSTFAYASDRLRGDPAFINFAVEHAGLRWKSDVLPFVSNPPLKALLKRVSLLSVDSSSTRRVLA